MEKVLNSTPGAQPAHFVLVTDGEQRAALAVVRSLGSGGWRCLVGSVGGRSLAGSSRFAAAEVVLPDPVSDPHAYASRVAEIVEAWAINLVIPIAEPAMLALLGVRDRIPAVIPFPDLKTFEAICDKQNLLHAAADLGIRVPRQVDAMQPTDAAGIALRAPYVLKPHRSVCTNIEGSRIKLGVSWAHTQSELAARLASYPPAAYPIIIQEVVTGPGIGIFVLLDEQGATASFAHRRIREKPPTGGVSVLRQSEPMNAVLLDRSICLLRRYGWRGVAMVEYKIDDSTGEPVLMEINGRFWGSLQLAIDAGVDFPRLLVDPSQHATRPVRNTPYTFVRSRWFWGDVDHLLAVWRDARSSTVDRLRALVGWVTAFLPGYREEIFRWNDPRPFMFETKAWFGQALRL